MLDEYLAVGEIVRPQGLRGEVKIKPLTDNPDRFFDLKRVRLQGKMRALRSLRVHEGFVYARLEGVYSRDAADALRGVLLYIHRDNAVPLPADTDFICDLIGCEAVDTEGVSHGVLKDVLQPGGVDVYVFQGLKGELMAPALKRVVLEVDVAKKHILLDADGLRETAVYNE
ncbi:MAG: ribosome maturation factor RimM [Firmicutes bacterium]|nr:ribosome maturation factor RimM [Bacillota bacterium]